jgi:monofunctional biosynthetic peptidoglycan transglycosylase
MVAPCPGFKATPRDAEIMMRRGMFRPKPRRRWGRRLLLLAVAAIAFTVLQVLVLRWIDPPTSAFMLAHRGQVRQQWRDLDAISPQLPIAVVAAEDQKFPSHRGFDVDAIREALDEREAGEGTRGASTLSQQVAKNLFLWNGRNWVRKGLEAWYTVLIEALWPKRRILEVYVNVAEFGEGVYGAEAAAQQFFGRPAAQLTPAQSALLAAVLPNPRRLLVAAPSAYVRGRQAWIERQVRQLGGPGYLERAD